MDTRIKTGKTGRLGPLGAVSLLSRQGSCPAPRGTLGPAWAPGGSGLYLRPCDPPWQCQAGSRPLAQTVWSTDGHVAPASGGLTTEREGVDSVVIWRHAWAHEWQAGRVGRGPWDVVGQVPSSPVDLPTEADTPGKSSW